jgi:hypothetical protein
MLPCHLETMGSASRRCLTPAPSSATIPHPQNEEDIRLYQREIALLAEKEARQRETLKALWGEKQALVAKDERCAARRPASATPPCSPLANS